jgi:hypothetical protein
LKLPQDEQEHMEQPSPPSQQPSQSDGQELDEGDDEEQE